MPKVNKDGKVSLNLKLAQEEYLLWVSEAGKRNILNMTAFIKKMVEVGIKNDK